MFPVTNYLNFVLMSIQILPDIPLKADARKNFLLPAPTVTWRGMRERSSSIHTPGVCLVHLDNSGVTPLPRCTGREKPLSQRGAGSASILGQSESGGEERYINRQPLFFCNWRIVALQCCIGFCRINNVNQL